MKMFMSRRKDIEFKYNPFNCARSAVSETTNASTAAHFYKEPVAQFYSIPSQIEQINETDDLINDDGYIFTHEVKTEREEEFVGENAFNKYYKTYKKFSKAPGRYLDSPGVAFMNEGRKLNIPPAPFGLIKRKGKENEINIMNYHIGNNYAKALSGSMKHLKPKAILLGGNNNTHGIMNIIHNLNEQGEKIDLSNNFVNGKTITMMCSWMTRAALTNKSKLKSLNLKNNRLSEELLLVLGRGIRSSHPDLKELNLSKNMMGDFSTIILGEYGTNSLSLEILDLSWNRITPFGGTKLFEGLRAGRTCRNVNISYNLLGKSTTFEFVEAVQLAVNEDNF